MRRRPNVEPDAPPSPGGIITAIVASSRAPGRFSIVVEGAAAHTLGLAAIERLGLALGVSTVGREHTIAREEAILRTYDRAVMMLAARGRAAKDLERQLLRKGEPAEFARLAVERLASEGFLDDTAYARSYVRSKAAGAGFARRRIQQELGRRGVERAAVDEAIEEVFEEEEIDEVAAATTLASKRIRSLGNVDPQSRKRRLYAYLTRRGYSPDVIGRAILAAAGDHLPADSAEVADESPA